MSWPPPPDGHERDVSALLAVATLVGVQAPVLAGAIARGAGLDRFGPGLYMAGAAATAFAVIGVATLVIVPPRSRR